MTSKSKKGPAPGKSKPGRPGMKIERVPIATLKLDPTNPRTHDERNVALIEESLRRFGQVEPLVVQKKSRRLIAGHGRLAAMQKAGIDVADVYFVDCTDAKARHLAALLNRSGELAGWDGDKLAALVAELQESGVDVDASLGFSDEELADLVGAVDEPEDDDDRPEDPGGGSVRFNVLVLCQDEDEQTELLKQLAEEGYECRALSSPG